jgi:phosphinothricin acetyltransferase
MIRPVRPTDVKILTDIYNGYIKQSTATFETERITADEMMARVTAISSHFPYFVFDVDGDIAGYCYAHLWKERAAYRYTLETTVYVSPRYLRRGIGMQLMTRLIDECRHKGYRALIACITEGNEASIALHRRLGFRQVSSFENVGVKFGRELGVTDFELLIGNESFQKEQNQ